MGGKRAVMFGGSKELEYFNDLLIIELGRNSVVSVYKVIIIINFELSKR